MSKLTDTIKQFPDEPGIYKFFGPNKELMYIGKATSLRNRVRSYFAKDIAEKRSPLIAQMVERALDVDFEKTDSVLEALLLEAYLIKKYLPRYNTDAKDNKSFNYVVITNEEFPRLLVERGRSLPEKFSDDDIKYLFGPFTQGGSLKEALKIIRRIFPYYDTKFSLTKLTPRQSKRLTFNKQIGVYPGIPGEDISKAEYARTVNHIRLFFEGKKKKVIKELKKEMKILAKAEEFEMAEQVKRQIFSLEHINDVALIKADPADRPAESVRLEAYDISHLAGTEVIGVMVVVEDSFPKKSDYRKFKIRRAKGGNDTAAIQEVLERRQNHPEWPQPDIVVIDGGKAQRNAASKVWLQEGVVIVSVVKDDRHRPREILGDKVLVKKYEREILIANAEAHRFAVAFQTVRRKKRFLR